MESQPNKYEKDIAQNPQNKKDFFRLTKHQLSVNLDKYEDVLKSPSVTIFNSKQIDPQKVSERPVVFQKRLNSTDSAMLEESAYIALDNPELKLEKRIENCEESLKALTEKLIVAETIQDESAQKELLKQKNIVAKKLENLQAQYKEQNLDTKLTSVVAKFMRMPEELRQNVNKKFKHLIRHSKLLRKYTPFVRAMMVRETLGRLDKINKSVDELVKMQVPFGEQEARYETLVNHLSRAGALHSQILKELKG